MPNGTTALTLNGGVAATSSLTGNLQLGNSRISGVSDITYIDLYNPTTGNLSLINTSNNATVGNIIFKTNNSEAARITTAGNIGIGTTSSATTLSVAGSGYLTVGLGVGVVNTGAGTIKTSGAATFNGDATTTNADLVAAGDNLYFGGKTASNAFSKITKQSTGNKELQFYSANSTLDTALTFWTSTANERLIIDSTGNVGIGTTSPNATLDVAGKVLAAEFDRNHRRRVHV